MLITFEGIDGCGKTTQAILLTRFLRRKIDAIYLREPGNTEAGEAIRNVIMKYDLSKEAELLLFNAARAELVQKQIIPIIDSGRTIVLDCYFDSTLAYQCYGDGLNRSKVTDIIRFTGAIEPNLTLFLDLEPHIAIERKKIDNRFDKKDLDYYRRVRNGYYDLVHKNPERWIIIDAASDVDQIAETIQRIVGQRMSL